MTLDRLKVGGHGRILAVGGEGALRRRLLDMGLTPGTRVMVRKVAPMGDPIELNLRGYELTIRLEDAQKIEIMEEEA
ncbi:MAG: ferrous iron transport protein A [Candidatus Spyradocola sp.]